MVVFAYCRVSTVEQSSMFQEEAILKAYPEAVVLHEQKSGTTKAGHDVLNSVLGKLSVGDKLVVWKLDRLARNMGDLLAIVDIIERKLDEAADEFKSPSWFGPQWVAAHNPADAEARNTLMFEAIMGGADISARPNLYVPVNEQWQNIQNRAQELTKLAEFNTNAALEAELGNDWQMQPYTWLPLKANNQDMMVLVGEQGKVIEIIDLRPWGK